MPRLLFLPKFWQDLQYTPRSSKFWQQMQDIQGNLKVFTRKARLQKLGMPSKLRFYIPGYCLLPQPISKFADLPEKVTCFTFTAFFKTKHGVVRR